MPKTGKDHSFSYSKSARSLQDNASRAGNAAAVSYSLIGAIVLMGGLGYGFDWWRGTSPWGLVVGLLLGIVVGFYELIKTMWRK
jgi:ATP synthase protein I